MSNSSRIFAIICLAIMSTALASCGTKYQEMGLTGGVKSQQLTKDTYRILARGNGYTGSTTIQDYALLKAAEVTKAAGGTHFAIMGSANTSRTSYVRTAATSQTQVIGNSAYTTFNPGSVYTQVKPGQDMHIKVLTLSPKAKVPAGVISADEIIQFVGSRVKRAALEDVTVS